MNSFLPKRHYLPAFIFLACTSTFTGCLTPAKIDGWIGEKYATPVYRPRKNDYIAIKMETPNYGNAVSVTKKDKTKVLPLVLYWRFEYSQTSTLNPTIPLNYFTSSFVSYANSKRLKQKLNGGKLELSIDKLPNSFSWKDVDHAIIPIVQWESIYFQPQKQDIVVSYTLLKDNQEVKKGTITVPDINQKLYLKYFQFSGKKFIGRYLDQYNNNIQTMSRQLVDKLMSDLDT